MMVYQTPSEHKQYFLLQTPAFQCIVRERAELQHMPRRPRRSFSWISNNAGMPWSHRAGATIFQDSPLDEGDESLERAAAAIWVQSAAKDELQRLFLLDKSLTIQQTNAGTHILLEEPLVPNQRNMSETEMWFNFFTDCLTEMTEDGLNEASLFIIVQMILKFTLIHDITP